MTAQQVQQSVTVRVFTRRFAATRLGAALARKFAVERLDDWGVPRGTPVSDAVALLVGELAANAALHGRVPGRDFELRLRRVGETGGVRIEVSDTHPERPDPSAVTPANTTAETGRGLQLVEAVAHRWGVDGRSGPGKTVWAETGPMGAPDGL